MEKLLILDSNSLINRAYYALPLLTNNEGVHTNAIYGFTNMLLKIKEDINPDYIVAAFDKKTPTFRHKEYSEYKSGRKKMPPELSEQFPIIQELLKDLNINIFEIDGFEADDIIGTVAKIAEAKGIESYIVTGDKDALQLAAKNTKVMITKKGVSETIIYDEEKFINEFNITPIQFIDVKGLMGDKSDNIPGVPGIGEKTAFKLIEAYGSIEGVFKNIDKISGKKLKENLENNKEKALFSKKLATITKEVPIKVDFNEIKSIEDYDKEKVKKLLLRLQIKSLLTKFSEDHDTGSTKIAVETIKTLERMEEIFNEEKEIAFIQYTVEDQSIYSKISLNELILGSENQVYRIDFKEVVKENKNEAVKVLKEFMEDGSVKKVVHDAKELMKVLGKYNIELKNIVFDTAIAAYIIDSSKGKYELGSLINDYLRENLNGEDAEVRNTALMKPLYEELKMTIEKGKMEKLYYDIELPLVRVLAYMEAQGFNVNKNMLDELSIKFKGEIEKTQRIIYEFADEEFNISSPKQLGKILFEKMDLTPIKKTKTGYSTNADVLEKLKDEHPIIQQIIYYRQITKLNSTYIEGLKNVIDKDGKIHSNFNQTVTTTGRLSSTEPNLQNIPVKYEMGREIRKVFVPNEEGDILLSCDYSQIELRVLAHMANDENMINSFKHHSDIHRKTASEVFNIDIEEVTPLMRSRAKAVNFGIVYGMSDFSLGQDLKISKKEAGEYMNIYFDRYPNIKSYLENTVEKAKEDGFVLTVFNRRRFIPEIKSSNKIVKALGERLAMNAPIQGSAADIIKIAMVNVYKRLKSERLTSSLILQVHDELILNVKPNEEERVKALVKEEMENALKLKVPLDVDTNEGKTWYDVK